VMSKGALAAAAERVAGAADGWAPGLGPLAAAREQPAHANAPDATSKNVVRVCVFIGPIVDPRRRGRA